MHIWQNDATKVFFYLRGNFCCSSGQFFFAKIIVLCLRVALTVTHTGTTGQLSECVPVQRKCCRTRKQTTAKPWQYKSSPTSVAPPRPPLAPGKLAARSAYHLLVLTRSSTQALFWRTACCLVPGFYFPSYPAFLFAQVFNIDDLVSFGVMGPFLISQILREHEPRLFTLIHLYLELNCWTHSAKTCNLKSRPQPTSGYLRSGQIIEWVDFCLPGRKLKLLKILSSLIDEKDHQLPIN